MDSLRSNSIRPLQNVTAENNASCSSYHLRGKKHNDKVFGSENVAAFVYRYLFYSWINGCGVQLFLETLGKSLLDCITENHENCGPGLLFVCFL